MSKYSHGDRHAILARVKEALSRTTDSHVKAQTLGGEEVTPHALVASGQRWLPPVSSDHASRVDLFMRISEKLKTRFEVVADLDKAAGLIHTIAREERWNCVGGHHASMVERCLVGIDSSVCWTDEDNDYEPAILERCDAGITTCEALIAQTGSVMVTCSGSGGRALSVLPPHHIVIATANQLLPDLAAGYQVLRSRYGEALPSQISFITGPSRTGDIERILVLGAHGPKKLTVILIDSFTIV